MNLIQFMDGMQSIASAAAPMAVTALWQGAAIALGLALCLRWTPRSSAHLRFLLWSVGFATLLALPFLHGISSGHAATAGVANDAKPWIAMDLRWGLAIAGMWGLMSLVRAADLAVHSLRLRRLWKSAVPVEIRPATVRPARAWGRRELEICTTQDLDRPSVIGFFAPRILIPEWLYERLTDAELNQIVLHEGEHLRRCDDWTNLLQKLCLVLFPLNPALWWMERQLCKEREMACDEGVVAITRAPRAYAACLASIAERGLERRAEALSLGAWQRRPELVRRVHSILRKGHALSPFASGALMATLGGGLLAVSFEFAHCPQFVAFVPVRATTLAAQHNAGAGVDVADAVYRQDGRRLPGFRAVEAKAVIPAAAEAAPRMESTAAHHAVRRAATAGRRNEAQAQLASLGHEAVQGPQWIVMTSWEQIETSSVPSTQPGNSAQSDMASDATSPAEAQMTSRVTVTQLVFRVMPSGAKSSQASQPQAVRFRNGWLVFQL
ncbi:MAG: M56 family metallopeptidase [Terracidiphilus sp.]